MIRSILYLSGVINLLGGLCMVFPLGVCLAYGEAEWKVFLISSAVTCTLSCIPLLPFRREAVKVTHRTSLGAVGVGWFTAPLFAALPFYLSGQIGGITDCYFEAVSGFTTTGSSILERIEGISKGVLFWRAFIQWLGGMGIVLVTVAVLASLGVGAMELYKAEVPGLKDEKLHPRVAVMARTLWITYMAISLLEMVLLMLGGMELFDAACHTFTTMATGGYSTKTASVGAFPSPYIQWTVVAFMLVAGTDFAIHATVLSHKGMGYLKSPELRFYAATVLTATTLLCLSRAATQPVGNIEEFVRENAFTTVSIMTTTGYAVVDYEKWQTQTHLPTIVLLILMFVGGMGGSTAGGIKCVRLLILFRIFLHEMARLIHPRAVSQVKLKGKTLSSDTLVLMGAFFFIYVVTTIAATCALAFMGLDGMTSFSAVAATINNIGPGFGTVGPAENYAHLPTTAKWVLISCMIIGRLEVFTVLALFFPSFWRK